MFCCLDIERFLKDILVKCQTWKTLFVFLINLFMAQLAQLTEILILNLMSIYSLNKKMCISLQKTEM